MAEPNNGTGYTGFQDTPTIGHINAETFMIWSVLARITTAKVVQVMAVTNSGGVSPVGFVDIQPMVNQIDGTGNSVAHGVIYHCPYFRLQGGTDAIILDPKVGDIGVAIFADSDISSVVATKAQANPGSRRRFDMADALYIGGYLNGTPVQYVEFSASGIKIVSPTAIELDAPDIKLVAPTVEINASTSATVTTPRFTVNGDTILNGQISQGAGGTGSNASLIGPLTVTNDVTASGTSVHTHTHKGVTPGSGSTGGPN
jgi:Phage protein Gp138 N-terminal domain